ncbi:MAG: dUTP diphosphatase [Gammaproteobacteria bacterium]|nr:dUTP diphosphatase [Gammaproteobacteria bacterium]
MARMQEAHNLQVHPDWRTKRYEYYRAIWIECAELLDHFGWKWWKRQDADLAQVKLELVDIWHFGLSELLRADAVEPQLAVTLDVRPSEDSDPEGLRQAVEALANACLASQGFSVERFAGVMRALPMTLDELFRLYVGKNVLNGFRQDHGYKVGTYRKAWAGREDNEHLMELLDGVDEPATAAEDLYAKLETRYRETATR